MLPSSGYFRGINCPGQESQQCTRPYCQFRHVSRKGRSRRSHPQTPQSSTQAAPPPTSTEKAPPPTTTTTATPTATVTSSCSSTTSVYPEGEKKGSTTTSANLEREKKEEEEKSEEKTLLAEPEEPPPQQQEAREAAAVEEEPSASGSDVAQSDILHQLVSDAVKKVLAENHLLANSFDPSEVMKSIDTAALMAHVKGEDKDLQASNFPNKKKYYFPPPDTPSYNPTPINQLRKRKLSSEDEEGTTTKHLKYTPTPIARPEGCKGEQQSREVEEDEVTDFSSEEDEGDVDQRRSDFDLLEEVLAEQSQNNKVKVKKKKVKELGKLKYSLNHLEKKVAESSMITDARKLKDSDADVVSRLPIMPSSVVAPTESYFLPPSPIFTSSSDGFECFNSIVYARSALSPKDGGECQSGGDKDAPPPELAQTDDSDHLKDKKGQHTKRKSTEEKVQVEKEKTQHIEADKKEVTKSYKHKSTTGKQEAEKNKPQTPKDAKKSITPASSQEPPARTSEKAEDSRQKLQKVRGHSHLPHIVHGLTSATLARPNIRNWSPQVKTPPDPKNDKSESLDEVLQKTDASKKIKSREHSTSSHKSTSKKKHYKVDLDQEIKSLTSAPSDKTETEVSGKEVSETECEIKEKLGKQGKDEKRSPRDRGKKDQSSKDESDESSDAANEESDEEEEARRSSEEEEEEEEEKSEHHSSESEEDSDSEEERRKHRRKRRRRSSSSESTDSDRSRHRKRKKKRKHKKHKKHSRSGKRRRRRHSSSSSETSNTSSEEEEEADSEDQKADKEEGEETRAASKESSSEKEEGKKHKKHKKHKKRSKYKKTKHSGKHSKHKYKKSRRKYHSTSSDSDSSSSRGSSSRRGSRQNSSERETSREESRSSGDDSCSPSRRTKDARRRRSQSGESSSGGSRTGGKSSGDAKSKSRRKTSRRSRSNSTNYDTDKQKSKKKSESVSRHRTPSQERSRSGKKRSRSRSNSRKRDKKRKETDKENEEKSKGSRSSSKSENSSHHHESNKDPISVPMPVDPSQIKKEKDVLIPDLSIVKIEKQDKDEVLPSSFRASNERVKSGEKHKAEAIKSHTKESRIKREHEVKKTDVKNKTSTEKESSSISSSSRRRSSHERKSSTEEKSEKKSSHQQHSSTDRRSSDGSKCEEKLSPSWLNSQPQALSMFDLVLASSQQPRRPSTEVSIFDKAASSVGWDDREESNSDDSFPPSDGDVGPSVSFEDALAKTPVRKSSVDENKGLTKSSHKSESVHKSNNKVDHKSISSHSHKSSHSTTEPSSSSNSHRGNTKHSHSSSSKSKSSSQHRSSESREKSSSNQQHTVSSSSSSSKHQSGSSSKHHSGHRHSSSSSKSTHSSSNKEKEVNKDKEIKKEKFSSSSSRSHNSSSHSSSRHSSSSRRRSSSDHSTVKENSNKSSGSQAVEGSEGRKKSLSNAVVEGAEALLDAEHLCLPEDGSESPIPDLSMLDEISQDDWDQMLSMTDTTDLANSMMEDQYDGSSMGEAEDPQVMEECMKLFSEYKPQAHHTQVLPKKLKPSVSEEAEVGSGRQRVAHSTTGNLIIKRPNLAKKNPTQMLIDRIHKMKAREAELKKKLWAQKEELGRGKLGGTAAAAASTHPSSSVSSGVGKNKKRISHVPYAAQLLNEGEKIKNLHPPEPSHLPSSKKAKKAAAAVPHSQTLAQSNPRGSKRIAHVPREEILTRPIIPAEFGSKVPQNVRQRYLNTIIDECAKFRTQKEAFNIGAAEERVCFQRATTRMTYLSLVVNTVKRLRTKQEVGEAAQELLDKNPNYAESMTVINSSCEPQPSTSSGASSSSSRPHSSKPHPTNPNHVSLSHSAVLSTGGLKGSWSIEPRKTQSVPQNSLKGEFFYKNLKKYILMQEELEENGYPFPDPNEKGKAELRTTDIKAKISPSSDERYCDRCCKLYAVDKWGFPTTTKPCVYHWGRAYKRKYFGRFETRYSCCGADQESEGCTQATTHVSQNFNPKKLYGYVRTLPKDQPENCQGVFALDCEMCYTTYGNELTRVTVINEDGDVVYEQMVKPDNPIIDYNTRFSGITEADMEGVETTQRDVQAAFLTRFSDKTIFIGHSLESDLRALKIIHDTVVDTAIVFPHRLGKPYKRALRNLASEYLKLLIQNDVSGHDSAEDALTCMNLMKWRIKEDLKSIKN